MVFVFLFQGMGIDGPGFGGMNRMGGGTCSEVLCIKYFFNIV